MTAGALATLVRGAPVLTALAVDFRRNQWTFTLPPQPVGPGEYVVLRREEAREAVEQAEHADGPQDLRLLTPSPGTARIFTPNGTQALTIEADGFELTVYREHVPAPDRDKYWDGPAIWWGSETRTATDGSEWMRRLRLVCDDFGMLVEVRS